MDSRGVTEAHIYGLNTNTEYEVRVRSRMRGYNSGVFSDPIVIVVPSQGTERVWLNVLLKVPSDLVAFHGLLICY